MKRFHYTKLGKPSPARVVSTFTLAFAISAMSALGALGLSGCAIDGASVDGADPNETPTSTATGDTEGTIGDGHPSGSSARSSEDDTKSARSTTTIKARPYALFSGPQPQPWRDDPAPTTVVSQQPQAQSASSQ